MYETRKELIKKMHDLCEDLNECEVELECKKEPDTKYIDKYIDEQFPVRLQNIRYNIINNTNNYIDNRRRLDRLEECIAVVVDRLIDPGDMLLKNITDMREEQAAVKGDQDEE